MEEGGKTKRHVLDLLGVKEDHLLGAFVFGSRAFGTATPTSGNFYHVRRYMKANKVDHVKTGIFTLYWIVMWVRWLLLQKVSDQIKALKFQHSFRRSATRTMGCDGGREGYGRYGLHS